MVANGTTRIRQNYKNSNFSSAGINMQRIMGSPCNSSALYYYLIGSGVQQNRIYNFAKSRGLLLNYYQAYGCQNQKQNVPFLSYVTGRGPGSGILDTNFGWDADGVWFSGNAGSSLPSYPIFTNFTIPSNKPVEVTVDYVYSTNCSDFGFCFYQDGTIPQWSWSQNTTRIACSYNCENPEIYGLDNEIESSYTLTDPNIYTCNAIYNPLSNPNITLNTKFGGTIVDTITLDDQVLASDYRIGFSADQDSLGSKTYIKNLTINVNSGEQIYTSSLQNVSISPF